MKRVKGVKYMVMEGDQTLGTKHTTEYADVVLYSCTPEIYVINQYYLNK